MATLYVSDRKNKTLSVVYVSRLYCMKRLENLICTRDSINKFVRCAAVTSLANHSDSNPCHCCEKWPFANSYVAFVKIRDVVKTVNFVDTFKAPFLDHRFGPTWSFLGRLEQKPDTLA